MILVDFYIMKDNYYRTKNIKPAFRRWGVGFSSGVVESELPGAFINSYMK